MRVAFVAPGFSINRSQRQPWVYVDRVARGLSESGFDVTVLTDRNVDASIAPHFDIVTVSEKREIRALLGGHRVDQFLRRLGKVDVLVPFLGWLDIALHKPPPQRDYVEIAAVTSPPLFDREWRNLLLGSDYSMGTNIYLLLSHLLAKRLLPQDLSGLNGMVATSPYAHQLILSQTGLEHVLLAPSGIDPDVLRFRHPGGGAGNGGEGTPMVTYCGPPRRSRGFDVLFDVLRFLQRRRPDVSFQLLLRPDSPRDEKRIGWFKRRLDSLPSPDRVIIETETLPRADFLQSLASSTACLFPFQYAVSMTPISLLEALAVRTPVVVTPVGDLPEFAGNAPGTVAADCRPPQVARSLLQVLEREEANTAIQESHRPLLWGDVIDRWANFLRSVIELRRSLPSS